MAIYNVIGGRALRAQLKAAGDDLSDLKDANTRAAQIVVARARPAAPVGSVGPKSRRGYTPGKLAASVRGSGTKTGAAVRAGFAATPYAGPIEWGWPAHGIERHAFLVPAAHDTEELWLREYENAVDDALARCTGEA